jgi:hypothetical protein
LTWILKTILEAVVGFYTEKVLKRWNQRKVARNGKLNTPDADGVDPERDATEGRR